MAHVYNLKTSEIYLSSLFAIMKATKKIVATPTIPISICNVSILFTFFCPHPMQSICTGEFVVYSKSPAGREYVTDILCLSP